MPRKSFVSLEKYVKSKDKKKYKIIVDWSMDCISEFYIGVVKDPKKILRRLKKLFSCFGLDEFRMMGNPDIDKDFCAYFHRGSHDAYIKVKILGENQEIIDFIYGKLEKILRGLVYQK